MRGLPNSAFSKKPEPQLLQPLPSCTMPGSHRIHEEFAPAEAMMPDTVSAPRLVTALLLDCCMGPTSLVLRTHCVHDDASWQSLSARHCTEPCRACRMSYAACRNGCSSSHSWLQKLTWHLVAWERSVVQFELNAIFQVECNLAAVHCTAAVMQLP